MILERDARTAALIGEDALEKLKNAKVLIAGIGGVGGYIAEALARAGVGTIGIVDSDRVAESNINRQGRHGGENRPHKSGLHREEISGILP